MAESLFSPNWYRVASLKPRLRGHAAIHRHQYRGQTWYILQDRSSERYHRFSPSAYYLIGLLDGTRTVEEIWQLALAKLGDDAVTQDEMIQLLGQLHAADVLISDVSPDTAELFQRYEKQERQKVQKRVFSIFAWQFPLLDPEGWLQRFLPIVRPAFTVGGFVVWLAIVGLAAVLAGAHWDELATNVLDRVVMPGNLFALWLLFPVIKAIHEFGHAFAVKRFGGEVHEMGIMLLVFTPVPYVDASGSWAFASKWQRFIVGSAGMMAELFVAALAMFLWVSIEPGVVRAALFNVMLIAGVTTVLFNANPLMRFDGYYMLMDYLEIPNLRGRATQYFVYLAERHLFGRREAEPPPSTRGERAWFVAYGIGSFLYRILVVIGILLFLGGINLLLGAIFALVTAIAWLVVPAVKIVHYLAASPRIRRVRRRAVVTSWIVTGLIVAVFFALPLPFRTTAEGIVWVPEEGLARAGADGFVAKVVARPGSQVKPGDVLIELRDLDLTTEVAIQEARLAELDAKHRQAYQLEPVKAQIIDEERQYVASALARARERMGELTIVARTDGEFVLPRAEDLPGRQVRKGELVAHVVNKGNTVVRTVVTQSDVDLVRNLTRRVDVRLAENIADARRATVKRVVPSATEELPSAALGTAGGGKVPVDPADKDARRSLEKIFLIDVDLPVGERPLNLGGRAYVRFDLGWEPIGWQWYRRARQLFLSRFNV